MKMKLRLIFVALVLASILYFLYSFIMHYQHKAVEKHYSNDEYDHGLPGTIENRAKSAMKQQTVFRTSKYGKSLSKNNLVEKYSRNKAGDSFVAASIEAKRKTALSEDYAAEEGDEDDDTIKHRFKGLKKLSVNNHDLISDSFHGVQEDNEEDSAVNIPEVRNDRNDNELDDADDGNMYKSVKKVIENDALPQQHNSNRYEAEDAGIKGYKGDEDADDYVSLDDIRDDETKKENVESVGLDDRRTPKEIVQTELNPVETNPTELIDEMAEIEIENSRLEMPSLKENDPVVPRAHLRSHNIAPIPRVPGQTLVQSSSKLLRSNLPDLSVMKTRQGSVEDSDFGLLLPQSQDKLKPEAYYLIHAGRASKVNQRLLVNPLPDYIPSDHYILKSNSLPNDQRLRPSIGNGYLATVIHGTSVHMSGLYNGLESQSHRAAIPSTCSFKISKTNPEVAFNRSYQLNVGSGVFSEVLVAKSFTVTQKFYAHRSLSNLIVVEVDLDRSDTDGALSLLIDLNAWTSSYDFTFFKRDIADKNEVSYKVGTLNANEMIDTPNKQVHIIYDHVPNELVAPKNVKRTKWIFLTSVGTSKVETELCYNSAVKRIHAQDLLYLSHVRGWASLLQQGRVDIEGNASLARAAYASWYSILSSVPLNFRPDFVGISPSGLPLGDFQKDYEGRVTHEQELWIFPSILLFHNELAGHVLLSRLQLLDGAMQNAKAIGQKGALFPWQSGATGRELSADIRTGLRHPYVGAGIVWSVLQSVYASGNSSFVTNSSAMADMLGEICHALLGSVKLTSVKLLPGSFTSDYGIFNVSSLDGLSGRLVDNSPYVNGIVKQALSALRHIYGLENKTTTEFGHFADKIKLPVEDGIHPAHDRYYRDETFNQADAVLLGYPLLFQMSPDIRRNDLTHYEQAIGQNSASVTWAMHAIGWLELGEFEKAQVAFQKQLMYLKNAYQVWGNSTKISNNIAYNYLPAAGAYLQSIVNGYCGIRLHSDQLSINATLPLGVTRIHIVGIDYRGSVLDIVFGKADVMVIVTSKKPSAHRLRLFVFNPDETHTLTENVEVRFTRRPAALSVDRVLPDS